MKCGRKTQDSRVFCQDCMDEMAKYPIKPGTVVKLPSHPVVPAAKKRSFRRKRPLRSEDQIAILRIRCRWLTLALVVAVVALLLVSGMIIWLMQTQNNVRVPDFSHLIPGFSATHCFR